MAEGAMQRFAPQWLTDDPELQKTLQETAPALMMGGLGSKVANALTKMKTPMPAPGSIGAVEGGMRRMAREGGEMNWGVNGRVPMPPKAPAGGGAPNVPAVAKGLGATPQQMNAAKAAHADLAASALAHPGVVDDVTAFVGANPNPGPRTTLTAMKQIAADHGFEGLTRYQLRRLHVAIRGEVEAAAKAAKKRGP